MNRSETPRFIAAVLSMILLPARLAAADAVRPVSETDGCEKEQSVRLGFLAGEWKVTNVFKTGGDSKAWETTSVKSSIVPIFPGCLWKEELVGERGGKELELISLYSYSNVAGKYQHTWAHSQHGMLTGFEGDFEGSDLVFTSRLVIRASEVIFRKSYKWTGTGFEVLNERSVDPGKNWQETWKLIYTK